MDTPTGLSLARAARKPFYVYAVQVAAENMSVVAEWCKGEICTTEPKGGLKRYIKLELKEAKSERQTRAYIGDWVLKADNGTFKVYTNKAYQKSFDLLEPIGKTAPFGAL